MFLGSSICHQIAERSYYLGDLQMPVCARCIGIHFGFFVSAAFLLVGPKRYCSVILRPRQLMVLGVVMAIFLVDGGLSYLEISPSDNLRRTLSGLALGVPLPFFLVPFINSFVFPGRNGNRPIETKTDWLWLPGLYALGAGAILLADGNEYLFYLVSVIGLVGLFCFFSANASLVALLGFDRSRISPRKRLLLAMVVTLGALMLVATVRQSLYG